MKCPNCGETPFGFGQFIKSLSITHHCDNCDALLKPNLFVIVSLTMTVLAAPTIGGFVMVTLDRFSAGYLVAVVSALLTVILGVAVTYRFGRYKLTDSAKATPKG